MGLKSRHRNSYLAGRLSLSGDWRQCGHRGVGGPRLSEFKEVLAFVTVRLMRFPIVFRWNVFFGSGKNTIVWNDKTKSERKRC